MAFPENLFDFRREPFSLVRQSKFGNISQICRIIGGEKCCVVSGKFFIWIRCSIRSISLITSTSKNPFIYLDFSNCHFGRSKATNASKATQNALSSKRASAIHRFAGYASSVSREREFQRYFPLVAPGQQEGRANDPSNVGPLKMPSFTVTDVAAVVTRPIETVPVETL